jgi:DNA-binding IclR family transcriptional regulator
MKSSFHIGNNLTAAPRAVAPARATVHDAPGMKHGKPSRLDPPGSQRAPAVTRTIDILRLLARSDRPLGVNAIAAQLDLIPSTCLHILRALVEQTVVTVEPVTKQYSLGPGLLSLAHHMLRKNTFINVVQPVLDDLSARHRLTAIGVQTGGLDHFVVVAISRAKVAYRMHVEIGSRFPALISATGRCVAAFGDFDAVTLERKFRGLRWDVPPSLATWRAEVEATRQRGYSIDEGNYIRGMTICAAPVFDGNGRMSHALITLGLSEQMRRAKWLEVAEELKERADAIGAHLGNPVREPAAATAKSAGARRASAAKR